MIHKYTLVGQVREYTLVSDVIPRFEIGIIIILSSCILILVNRFLLRKFNSFLNENYYVLMTVLFTYSGIFICTLYYIDEVFINLEHTYNLFHHGRFSSSPHSLVNGTVEYIYYLLLTPFAFTRESLVVASYLLEYFLGAMHVVIVWNILKSKDFYFKVFLLYVFISYLPFTWLFGTGFGNSIVSLGFFISLLYYLSSDTKKSLFIASMLPLFRPDAVLYSGILFLGNYWKEKKIFFGYAVFLLSSFLMFFLITKLYFGTWIPIPMKFKAFDLSNIILSDIYFVFKNLLKPHHIGFLIYFIFVILFVRRNYEAKQLSIFYPLLLGLTVFYWLNNGTQSFSRYAIGYYLFQVLFFVYVIKDGVVEINFGRGKKFNLDVFRILQGKPFYITFLALVITLVFLLNHIHKTRFFNWTADQLGVGGQIMDEIFPQNWSLAITEMNTFGFMNDREVIDLWGYSNPAIANSKIFSPGRTRNNPEFFMEKSPELFWYRTIDNSGNKKSDKYSIAEKYVLSSHNMGKLYNNLGNMLEVLKVYDVYLLYTQGWETIFFAKKEMRNKVDLLLTRKKYLHEDSRELNMVKVMEIYNRQ